MCERYMVVCDVIEEVDLLFLQKECRCDGVDRCITPSLVKKATVVVERLEIIYVSLRS